MFGNKYKQLYQESMLQMQGLVDKVNSEYFNPVKITKAVNNAPKTEGVYVWMVKPENISKDKSSRFNQWWIRGIESVEDYKGPEPKDDYADLPF